MLPEVVMKKMIVGILGIPSLVVLQSCYTPQGEYGGVWNEDPDPNAPGGSVIRSEQVGTEIGPWGGIYNYEQINFGAPE
jgi:hypothetical protein